MRRGAEVVQDIHKQEIGLYEHTNPTLGGVKWHHESSDSNKDHPPVESMHKINEEKQLSIVGPLNAGWI